MIRFIPSPSTQIEATPDGPSTIATSSVATPSARRLARIAAPFGSSPTAPTNATGIPNRAAMTA